MISVEITEEFYLASIEECKKHLYRRIWLTKRDKPPTHLDLCKKLDVVWKHLG